MNPLAKSQAFHDDGSPKRKYEIEERPDRRLALSISLGLLLANALVLLKSILLWSDAEARPEGGHAQGAKGTPKSADDGTTNLGASSSPVEEQPASEEDTDTAAGSGTNHQLFRPREVFIPEEPEEYPQAHTSGLPASNDNEALYGAAPGRAVDLSDAAAAAAMSAGLGSGGSGGGNAANDDGEGASDGPADGGGGTDDDEDDDEDGDNTSRPNRLPLILAPVVLADLYANETLAFGAADLLRHASDPDGDTLSVRNLRASSGTLEQRGDGSWLFTPELDDTSGVRFTYDVSDGKGAVVQRATLDLVARGPGHNEGTAGPDTLIGTPNADIIIAHAGDDTVVGREGDDLIYGGAGNDRIVAGDGNDVVYGDDGDDVVFGGAGNDSIFGGPGNDILLGEAGDDFLIGEDGNDTISGGDDNDVIAGGFGNDTLNGDAGHDAIDGGAGEDAIDGGDGDDLINAGLDADRVMGGNGADTFIAVIGDGADAYDGGDGSDSYDASTAIAAVIIDLNTGVAQGVDIGSDVLVSIENARGGAGDDVLTASLQVNVLLGGPGADLFVFGSSALVGLGRGARDRILDFAVGDSIDFNDISNEFAPSTPSEDPGLRKFVLISQGLEFTQPGQMRFKYEATGDGAVTVLEGNIDSEADADFELEIAGTYELRDDDFYWRS
jgi:Ca2+-binding RTX toxin-like protein